MEAPVFKFHLPQKDEFLKTLYGCNTLIVDIFFNKRLMVDMLQMIPSILT